MDTSANAINKDRVRDRLSMTDEKDSKRTRIAGEGSVALGRMQDLVRYSINYRIRTLTELEVE